MIMMVSQRKEPVRKRGAKKVMKPVKHRVEKGWETRRRAGLITKV